MKNPALLCLICLTIPFWASAQEPEAVESTPVVSAAEAPSSRDAGSGDSPLLENAASLIQEIEAFQEGSAAEMPGDSDGSGALRLDVRRCVELAIEQNAQVAVAQSDLEAAQARIGQATAAMFPQVKGSFGITRTEYNTPKENKLMTLLGAAGSGMGTTITGNMLVDSGIGAAMGIGQSIVTEMMTPKTVPDDKLETTEVTISQVLYAGGQIRAAIRASKHLAESQEWQKEVVLAQIEYATKEAFYDCLLTDALVRVAEGSIRTFERNLSDAQDMYDVGMISNFEVLRAKTELGSRQSDLVSAKNARKLAMANLRRILFLPQETAITLEPHIEWAPDGTPIADLIAEAHENRPEIRVLQSAVQAADQDLRRIKGQYLPQVGATAAYSNTEGGGLSVPDGWTFTLGAEMEIVAGGRRKYERREARANIDSLHHQLADLERLIDLDVTQAHIQLRDAMALVESTRGTVELGREGLRLAELRFQEGVGTQSETLDAELALTNAETSLVQALRNFAVANASIERATGVRWAQLNQPSDDSSS